MPERLIGQLRAKSILVLGFGKEGRSSLSFLLKHMPDAVIGIADCNVIDDAAQWLKMKPDLHFHCGPSYLEAIPAYELVLKSPGVLLPETMLRAGNISSQTDLFLQAYGEQTIGITGTKGKSTTAGLIHHLLQSLGRKSLLVGNIGLPCFEVVPRIEAQSTIVYELSANQLQVLSCSPHIAVVLNIFEEHLDYFGTYANYKMAKANIFRFAEKGDFLITTNDVIQKLGGSTPIRSKVLGLADIPDEVQLKIKGMHNRLNAGAAISALRATGLNHHALVQALPYFHGLPHRLEYLGVKGGIAFYNDSIATVPEATMAALETLGRVDFLILGGYDRGIQYNSLIDYLRSNLVPFVFLTGKAGARIGKELEGVEGMHLVYFEELEEVLTTISARAGKTSVCLLSPAAASYDRYKNFEHRGELFRQLVGAL